MMIEKRWKKQKRRGKDLIVSNVEAKSNVSFPKIRY